MSSAKTQPNWLQKWAMKAEAKGKNFQPFYYKYKPVNHKTKKSQVFTTLPNSSALTKRKALFHRKFLSSFLLILTQI